MSTKLYVGNLAFQTTSQELQEMFATAGTVESASVVEDRDTGRSRGFGFVEMASKEDGQKAIEQFNGKELNGRALNVNEARPRENRGGGGGGGRGGGFNRGGKRGGGGGRAFGGRKDRPARRGNLGYPLPFSKPLPEPTTSAGGATFVQCPPTPPEEVTGGG